MLTNRVFRLLSGSIAVVGLLTAALAGQDKEPPPDWRIGPYQGRIQTARDENGQPYKTFTGFYKIYHHPAGLETTQISIPGDYCVTYPRLNPRQILPIGGSLYEVKGSPRLGGDFLARIVSKEPRRKRSPRPTTAKELPEAIVPALTSYTVPLGGYGQLRGHRFQVLAILPETKNEMAQAEIQWHMGSVSRQKAGKDTIAIGGSLRFGPRAFRVRNIVPPDNKRHLVGWIELAPQPHVPKAPIDPWPLKTPNRTIQVGPGHRKNYEVWAPRNNPWFIHTAWIGKAKAVDPRDFTINLPGGKPGYPPHLESGQKIPILGQIYELKSRRYSTGLNAASLVEAESLPPGVTSSSHLFAVPLRAFARLHGPWFQVKNIARKAKQTPVAKIAVYGDERWDPKDKYEVTAQANFEEGDVVSIGEKSYRVENIVPADPKQKIVGWVEFDPLPISPAPKNQ